MMTSSSESVMLDSSDSPSLDLSAFEAFPARPLSGSDEVSEAVSVDSEGCVGSADASLPAASGVEGMIAYDTTNNKLVVSNGTAWETITSST